MKDANISSEVYLKLYIEIEGLWIMEVYYGFHPNCHGFKERDRPNGSLEGSAYQSRFKHISGNEPMYFS